VIVYTLKVDHDAGALHWRRTLSVDVLLMDTKYYTALRSFFQVGGTGDEHNCLATSDCNHQRLVDESFWSPLACGHGFRLLLTGRRRGCAAMDATPWSRLPSRPTTRRPTP